VGDVRLSVTSLRSSPNNTCNMNTFFSFDLFMVYILAKNYEIIHTDTRYCRF
jgi:hypothetical protein